MNVACLALLAVLCFAYGSPADAQESPLPAEVAREILCLYDSDDLSDESAFRYNPTWQYAQVVFEYLGWVPRYHDLRRPLPAEGRLGRVGAIFLWTGDPTIPQPEELCLWLVEQAKRGRRLVLFLEEPFVDAATAQPVRLNVYTELLAALGVSYGGELPGITATYDVVSETPDMVDFERKRDPALPLHVAYRSFAPENRVHLRVRRQDHPDVDLDLVVTGPRGGLVFESYAVYVDHRVAKSQWRLNPFRFFEEALGCAGRPRPDLSTLTGRRIYFSHIDGDGFENLVIDAAVPGERCAERFEREFLEKYPLPVTVSMIAYDAEKSPENARVGRAIFERSNVEPAVHTYAHPLDWRRGTLSYEIPGYRFDQQRETRGAVEIMNRLVLAEGKRVPLLLWAGDRNPSAEAIAVLDAMGVDNLNVDEVFFDAAHPSYSFVRPAFLPVGPRMQFNARSSSENLYTHLWTKQLWAFRNVIETWRRTGTPLRICPINLYHHFYVVEAKAPREVMHELYRWILSQPIHALTAWEYVQVAKGFLGARIRATSDGDWRVTEYGACRTIRFDREIRNVDLRTSTGVLGFKHELGGLYVHLDGGPARIVLTKESPARPYVEEASGEVTLAVREDAWEIDVRSRGPGCWIVAGVPASSAWEAFGNIDGKRLERTLTASAEGKLEFSWPEPARAMFVVRKK
ncbi:MAG: hypothetical protein HYY16_13120 [Planctomycetes bacterium]|nr:hypothetical protein [Planctomycetota bacterium]